MPNKPKPDNIEEFNGDYNVPSSNQFNNNVDGAETYGLGTINTPDLHPDKYSDGYIPTGNPMMSQEEELNQFKAGNQSTFQKIGNVLAKGVLDIIPTALEPVGTLLDLPMWYSSVDRMNHAYSNYFTKGIDEMRGKIDSAFPVYTATKDPTPITSADWWYQNGSNAIGMMGFLIPAGALEKGAGMLLSGLGDFMEATKFGELVGKGLSAAEDGSGLLSKVAEGADRFVSSGKFNKLGSTLLSSTALAHSTGMSAAAQTFKIAKEKYVDYYTKEYPTLAPEKINDLAKEAASKNAEQVLDRNNINILFYSLGIGNLFKGVKATSSFSSALEKGLLKDVGQSTAALYGMGVTGKFISDEANRDVDIKTGIRKDDGSTIGERFAKELVSKEGISSGAVGMLNALLMHGFTYMNTRGDRYMALERIKQNAKELGDEAKFDKLSKLQFANIVLDNSSKGTMKNVHETLNTISNLTPDKVKELGLSDDYLEKLEDYKDLANNLEKEFNKYHEKYAKQPDVANEIIINRYIDRENKKDINKVDYKIKQLNKNTNVDDLKHPLYDYKYNLIKQQVNNNLINQYQTKLDELQGKPNDYRDIETFLTKDEIQSKLKALNLSNHLIEFNNADIRNKFINARTSEETTPEQLADLDKYVDDYLYTTKTTKDNNEYTTLNLSDNDKQLRNLLTEKVDLETGRGIAIKKANILDTDPVAREVYQKDISDKANMVTETINSIKSEINGFTDLKSFDEFINKNKEEGYNLEHPALKSTVDKKRRELVKAEDERTAKQKIKDAVVKNVEKGIAKVKETADKIKTKASEKTDINKNIDTEETTATTNVEKNGEANTNGSSFVSIGSKESSLAGNNEVNEEVPSNEDATVKQEANKVPKHLEDGEVAESYEDIDNDAASDDKVSNNIHKIYNALSSNSDNNTEYSIHTTDAGDIDRVDLKIVKGATSGAHLSQEYTSVEKIYKSDKKDNKVNRRTNTNDFTNERNRIVANEIQKGDAIRFKVDKDYHLDKDNNYEALKKKHPNDFADYAPIAIEAKHNGKWKTIMYVHDSEWMNPKNKNVAPIISKDGNIVDNATEQYELVKKLRKHILDNLKDNEYLDGSIVDKANGKPVDNVLTKKVTTRSKDGKETTIDETQYYKDSGKPIIKKGKVSELLPEDTPIAIVSSDHSILGGTSHAIDMQDSSINTANLKPGMVVKVVKNNLGKTDLLPLIVPRLSGTEHGAFNVKNYLDVHFGDYDYSKLNEQAGTTLFNRDSKSLLKRYLGNYLYLRKFDNDTLTAFAAKLKQGKNKYIFNVEDDGTFKIGDVANGVTYSASLKDGVPTFTAEIDGATSNMSKEIFNDKLQDILHDKSAYIPFSVKLSKLDKYNTPHTDFILTKKGQINAKSETNDEFEIAEVKNYDKYADYVADNLQTTFNGTNKDSKGNYIYFAQPNVYFKVDGFGESKPEELVDNEVVKSTSEVDSILGDLQNDSESNLLGDLDDDMFKSDKLDGKFAPNAINSPTISDTDSDFDRLPLNSRNVVSELGSYDNQINIVNSLIKPIFKDYMAKELYNDTKFNDIKFTDYFNDKHKQLFNVNVELKKIYAKLTDSSLSKEDKLKSITKQDRALLTQMDALQGDKLRTRIKTLDIVLDKDNYNKLVNHAKFELNKVGITVNSDKFDIADSIEGEDSIFETSKYDDKAKLKVNTKYISSPLFKAFLYSIPDVEKVNGKIVSKRNLLGLDSFANIDNTYNAIAGELMDKGTTYPEFIKALKANDNNPVFSLVAKRLELKGLDRVRTEFVNQMSKYRHELQKFSEDNNGDVKLLNNNSSSGQLGLYNEWQDNNNITKLSTIDDTGKVNPNMDVIKPIIDKYTKDYNDYKSDEKLYKDKFANSFRTLLDSVGIKVSDETVKSILDNPNLLGVNNTSVILDPTAINSFTGRLLSAIKTTGDVDKVGIFNDVILRSKLFKLANVELTRNTKVFDLSSMDSKGNLIFEPQNYSYLMYHLKDIKNPNNAKLEDLLATSFSGNSLWLNTFKRNAEARNNFKITFFDAANFKDIHNPLEYKEITKENKDKIALSIFLGGTAKDTPFFGLTYGESALVPIYHVPKQDIKIFIDSDNNAVVGKDAIDLAFKQANNEINRIIKFQSRETPTKYIDYNKGADKFFIYRYLNKEDLAKELSSSDLKEIYSGDKLIITPKGNGIIKDVIKEHLNNAIKEQIDDFANTGFIQKGKIDIKLDEDTSAEFETLYSKKLNSKLYNKKEYKPLDISTGDEANADTPYYKNKTVLHTNTLKTALAHFIIQDKLAKAEMYYTTLDPAIVTSINKATGKVDYDATYKKLQKRLKGMLSPHITGNWEDNTSFTSVTAKDREITNFKHLEEYRDKLGINGYTKLVTSDGAEVTTLAEDIKFRMAYNLIDNKIGKSILDKIDAAQKDKTNKTNYFELSSKEKDAVLSASKPILYSSKYDAEADVNMVHFRKSGALALLPEMTNNLPIDKLRVAMEEQHIDRLAFDSTDKLGAVKQSTIFDSNGNYKKDIVFNPDEIQTLDRTNFGLQQYMPTNNHDISFITQLNSLAFDEARNIKGFKYKGKTYDGRELEIKKEDIRKKLFELGKQRVLDKFDISFEDGKYKFNDLSKIRDIVLHEAVDRKWNDIDIQQLALFNKNEFEIPLLFNSSLDRIQSVLYSALNKEVVKLKMNGQGSVQFPDLGIGKTITKDYTDLDNTNKNNTVFVDGYNNDTLDNYGVNKDGTVRPMQVLVSWGFTDNNDNLLDINKYTKINDDGHRVIDTNKLPKEVLNGIYTRIPKAKHGMTSPFEIVGFLPENMKKTVIVPDGITEQMGSDFDIDKMYSYLKYTYNDENGNIKVINEKDKADYQNKYDDSKADLDKYKELQDSKHTLDEQLAYLTEQGKHVTIDSKTKTKRSSKEYNDTKVKLDKVNTELEKYNKEYLSNLKHETNLYKSILAKHSEDNLLKNNYLDVINSVYNHPEIAKKALVPLSNTDIKDEVARWNTPKVPDITSWKYQRDSYDIQQNGKDLIGISALANIYNSHTQPYYLPISKDLDIRIIDDNGNILHLNNLGGTGKSVFIDEDGNTTTRTVSDNVQTVLDASVDNGADPQLGYANVSVNNINSILTGLRLKDSDGNSPSIEYMLRLTNTPIVKEYLQNILDIKNDSTIDSRGLETKLAYEKLLNAHREFEEVNKINPLSGKDLLDLINGDKDATKSISALTLFKDLYSLGDSESKVMSATMYGLRHGAGTSIYDSIDIASKIRNDVLDNSLIPTAYQLLGERKELNNIPYIEYNTELGKALEHTALFANNTLGKLIGVNESYIRTVLSDLVKDSGLDINGSSVKNVVDTFRRAVMSSKSNIVSNEVVSRERARLLLGNDSLYNRIQDYLKDNKNTFLETLKLKTTKTKNTAKRIAYDNTKGKNINEVDNINRITAMIKSDNPVLSNIGKDLVKYSYLVDPLFSPISFTRFVDTRYLKDIGVTKSLRDINLSSEYNGDKTNVNSSIFIKQMYQHQPWLASRVKSMDDYTNVLKDNKGLVAEFVIPKKKIGEPSDFMGYKAEVTIPNTNKTTSRWTLYEYRGVNKNNDYVYLRIDTAGNANKQGQFVYEYDLNGNTIHSIFSDNVAYRKFNGKQEIISTDVPSETDKIESTNPHIVDKYTKTGKLSDGLRSVKSNEYYTAIAKEFKYYIDSNNLNTNIAFDGSLPTSIAGVYKDGLVRLNKNIYSDTPEGNAYLEQKLLHETGHVILEHSIDNYFNNRKGNTKEVNAVISRLLDVYNFTKKHYTDSNPTKFIKLLSDFKNIDKKSINTEDSKYYGLKDLHEFINEVLVNKDLQKELNNIEYTKHKTVLGKLSELVQKVLKTIYNTTKSALGFKVKDNSVLDYSFKNIFDLLEKTSGEDRFEDMKEDAKNIAIDKVKENNVLLDDNNNPLILYRGYALKEDREATNIDETIGHTASDYIDSGYYFTVDKKEASVYAKGRTNKDLESNGKVNRHYTGDFAKVSSYVIKTHPGDKVLRLNSMFDLLELKTSNKAKFDNSDIIILKHGTLYGASEIFVRDKNRILKYTIDNKSTIQSQYQAELAKAEEDWSNNVYPNGLPKTALSEYLDPIHNKYKGRLSINNNQLDLFKDSNSELDRINDFNSDIDAKIKDAKDKLDANKYPSIGSSIYIQRGKLNFPAIIDDIYQAGDKTKVVVLEKNHYTIYDVSNDGKIAGGKILDIDLSNKSKLEHDKLSADLIKLHNSKIVLTKNDISRITDMKKEYATKEISPFPTTTDGVSNYRIFTKDGIIKGLVDRKVITSDLKLTNNKSNVLLALQQKLGDGVVTIVHNKLSINQDLLDKYNNKLGRFAAADNHYVDTEHTPVIKSILNRYNNIISMYSDKLVGNIDKATKYQIEDRIDTLKEQRNIINSDTRLETIKTVAKKELDTAESILNKPSITALDLRAVNAMVDMWSKDTTDDYLTQDQLINTNNVEYKMYEELDGKTNILKNRILLADQKLTLNMAKELEFKKPVVLSDMTEMKDASNALIQFMDTHKIHNPIVQSLANELSNADRNPTGKMLDYERRINKMFSVLDQDVELSKLVGKNYELFHKKDEDGKPTLGMIERTSNKWTNEVNEYRTKLSDLDDKFDRGIIKTKEEHAKRKYKLAREHYKKSILIDIEALGITGKVGTRNLPNYTFKDPSDYKKYLIDELGKNQAEEVIEDAKANYEHYKSDRDGWERYVNNDNSLSAEDKQQKIQDWVNTNNPENVLNRVFAGDTKSKSLSGLDYLSSVPRKKMMVNGKLVDTGYYDADFDTVMNNPKLKKLYNDYSLTLTELLNKLPIKVKNRLDSNFLPFVLKHIYDSVLEADGSKLAVINGKIINSLAATSTAKLTGDTESRYNKRTVHGEIKKELPISFLDKTQPNYMYSSNLKDNLKKFATMATNFEYKSAMEDKLLIAQDIIRKANKIQLDYNNKALHDSSGNKITSKLGNEHINKSVSVMIDKVLYDSGFKHHYISKKVFSPVDTREVRISELRRKLNRGEITQDEFNAKAETISQSDNKQITLLNFKEQSKLKKLALQIEREHATLEDDFENGKISEEDYNSKLAILESEYANLGGRNLSTTKVLGQFMYMTQLKGMALNATAGVGNFLFGIISIFTHANGRIEFNSNEAFKALSLVLKSRMNKNGDSNKIYNIMKEHNIIYDTIDARFDKVNSSNKFKIANKLDLYTFQTKTEYLIQAMSYIAKMLHTNIKDNNGKDISLFDAFGNNGKIDKSKVSEDVASDWNNILDPTKSSNNSFTKFRNSGIELNKMLHGNYDPSSPGTFKTTMFGKMLMQFRNWIPEGVYNRFSDEYYNAQLGRTIKGRWRTYGELGFGDTIKTLIKQIAYSKNAFMVNGEKLSTTDIENMRRNLGELAVAGSVLATMLALKMMINYDKDKGYDGIGTKSTYLMYNIMFRANQDLYFYNNPKTFYNILKSPLPATKVLTDIGNAFDGSIKELTQDNYKGQSWYIKSGKMFPILNQIPKMQYLSSHMLKSNFGYN